MSNNVPSRNFKFLCELFFVLSLLCACLDQYLPLHTAIFFATIAVTLPVPQPMSKQWSRKLTNAFESKTLKNFPCIPLK